MSGSETGIMSGRESSSSFGIGLHQKNSSTTPSVISNNMKLAYTTDGTAVYRPINSPTYQSNNNGGGGGNGSSGGDSGGGGGVIQHGINMNMSEPLKRKRGRPRKYGPDGTMSLGLSSQSQSSPSSPPPPPPPPPSVQTQAIVFSNSMAAAAAVATSVAPTSPNSNKKARGRPPGSGNKKPQQQIESHGSLGVGFTPHVITVKAGEDVSSKIMSFSQHGPRAVCILSANGAISNVTLRQAATSGGTVTYEGRFEILSLSGSFLLSETGGQRSRTGGLSVSLAGPDGRVLGGGVAGLLTAASPVQVVVGTFLADMPKASKSMKHEPSSAPSKYSHGGAGNGSPPSRGTLSESSGGPGSPLNQSTGACNNNTSGMPMSWK